MKIGIVINSNVRFAANSSPRLINSLLSCGFSDSDVFLICGGTTQPPNDFHSKVPTFFVDYDSIDYSGLIFLSNWESTFTHYFYLHDTTFVGPHFKESLLTLSNDAFDVIALRTKPSMNMGLYSSNYLRLRQDDLEAIKNSDLSEESLQHWKKWGVTNEDFLSWQSSARITSYDALAGKSDGGNPKVIAEIDFYQNGITRRIEYYEYLDLYKVKANWDLKLRYETSL